MALDSRDNPSLRAEFDFDPSQAESLEELKRYLEDTFRKVWTEMKRSKLQVLDPVTEVPPRPIDGQMLFFSDASATTPGNQGPGVYIYLTGNWNKFQLDAVIGVP